MLTFRQAIEEIGKSDDGIVRIAKLKNHAKVGYQDHPIGDRQCSGCSMFVAPDSCTAVEKPISPHGYCQLYEAADISQRLRELFADPAGVAKQQPGAADVHATTALGNEGRKRKAKDFLTTIGEMKGAKVVDVPEDGVGKKKDRKDAKMVKVYIVRHGKTKMNNEVDMSEDRIRGWADVPLVQDGRDEAKRTGKKLEKKNIEAIVSSDLSRASETADIIGKIIGIKPTTTTKLRPWDLGKYTGMSTKDAIPHILDYIHDKPDEPVPDGESFNDFRRRAFGGLAEAIKRAGGKQLVIVTHHRNERLFNAWHEAGMPDDHSIDLKEFGKKGEPPGAVIEFNVDLDALAGKQDDDNAVAKVWDSNDELPDSVKSSLPQEAQTVFRRVANDRMKAGHGEVSAIRQAWTAVKNGWRKEGDNWVRKFAGDDESFELFIQQQQEALRKQDDDVNAALHLYPLAEDTSMAKTPFPWDQNALSNLRPDQTPRFLAALTDPARLPVKSVSLNSLVAVQNRVDPNKVQSMVDEEPDVELPIVVRFNGRNVIADGHHRLAAHLLTGRKTAPVRFADLTAEDNAVKSLLAKGSPDQPRDDHGRFASGGESEVSHPDYISGQEGGDLASAMSDVPGEMDQSVSSIEDARQALEDASSEHTDIGDEEDDILNEHGPDSKEYTDWEKRNLAAGQNVADKAMELHRAVSDHMENTRNVLAALTSNINNHAQSYGVRAQKRFRAVVRCPECGAEKGQWHKKECTGHVPGDDAWSIPFEVVAKSDDQQLVFGWASISSVGGQDVIDKQGDIIPEDELEKAAYDYVLYCRQQGDMHERAGVGRLVESMVFTKQKQDVLAIDLGMVGWFVGFKVDDIAVWKRIKNGDLPEFSIGGKAVREPIEA